MGRVKAPRNLTLKKRIIQVLKENDDRVVSASELLELVRDTGLSQNFLPSSTNSLGQIMKSMKGVGKRDELWEANLSGKSYVSAGYYLESEEAFNEWVASKMV